MNWFAMSQGRDVFAIPGKVDSATSLGTNRLIKQGAKLIDNVEDIIEELKPKLKEFKQSNVGNQHPQAENEQRDEAHAVSLSGLSEEEALIYNLLKDKSRYADELIEQAGFSSAKVMSVLLKLEMQKIIRQFPGKLFSRSEKLVNS